MPGNLDHVRALVVIMAMPGCGACHEYLPRFQRVLAAWQAQGHPFVVGDQFGPGQIPVLYYDGTSQDPGIVAFADSHAVSGMPSTILLTRNAGPVKLEGAIDDSEIHALLHSATLANR